MISKADWNQCVKLFEEASSEDHENAHNYSIKKMEERWDKYLEFNIIRCEVSGDPIAFGGVYMWMRLHGTFPNLAPGLVRVVDRFYLRKRYRKYTYMPAITELVPYQTRKFSNYECFFSVQTQRKRRAFIRQVSRLDPSLDYTVLDELYWTTRHRDANSLQNIAATRKGFLSKQILRTGKRSLFLKSNNRTFL